MANFKGITLPDGITYLPDGGGGNGEKEWVKFIDMTVEETITIITQEIGFDADEIMLFIKMPANADGISSLKIWGETLNGRLLFQDNSFGDKTIDKYIRINIKNISKWEEWHEYIGNNNDLLNTAFAQRYNVKLPGEVQVNKATALYILAAKGFLQGAVIKAYAR